MQELYIRVAQIEDEPRLQLIRAEAFKPVFSSFRAILGDEIYNLAQRREDEAQEALLRTMCNIASGWELYAAHRGHELVGFVALKVNPETFVGEIGLNAVDPTHAGRGIGTAMYAFAIERMKRAGMKVAVVATGGDASHAPARRAYKKAGFNVEIPSVWMCRTL